MDADAHDRPLPNSYWVVPGELLAGEHPWRGVASPAAARGRLRELMDAGIDCFIDLTMPDELESYENELPDGVRYIRRPIRDHSIPTRREHMAQIVSDLELALREGRRVYIHCRAGIGRTGTAIGCFLVERGETGDRALDALNSLWQKCERAASWPYVPETEDQIDFVRAWTPTLSAAPLVSRKSKKPAKPNRPPSRPAPVAASAPATIPTPAPELLDRFRGALIGLAIGDALASATQGRKAGTFSPITDLIGGGPHELPPGAWSDDTAMALCLAESLLECQGFDVRDQVSRYTRWQKEGYLSATGVCVGITQNTARALGAAQWRRQVFAGSHDPKQLDPEVLSRIAPAVLFGFGSPADALRLACDASRATCQAPLALEACQVFAALIYAALEGQPKAVVLRPEASLINLDSLRVKIRNLLTTTPRPQAPRVSGTTVDVLGAAIWAFRATDNFREGALRAANLGGHSDTVTAAYGQLAGAFYGAQVIPAAWQSVLIDRPLITDFANRLFDRLNR